MTVLSCMTITSDVKRPPLPEFGSTENSGNDSKSGILTTLPFDVNTPVYYYITATYED